MGTARVLGPDIPAAPLAAARLLLAVVALIGAVAWANQLPALRSALRVPAVYVAGLAQVTFQVSFLAAVETVGVATGTLIAIGCTPLITGAVAVATERRVGLRWASATAVSGTGLVLLIGFSPTNPSGWGVLTALSASASYATYILAAREATASAVADLPLVCAVFSVAAVGLAPALLFDRGEMFTAPGLATVGYLALVATVIAYLLFNAGLRHVPAKSAATLGLVEPLVAVSLGVAILDESLGVIGLLGGVLLIAGLVVLVRDLDRDTKAVRPISG